jgi:hypothetical protein
MIKETINLLLKPLIHFAYPEFKRYKGYSTYWTVFQRYFVMQKIIGFNRKIPWPVHFTTVILGWKNIQKGICCEPGDNNGIYINAFGGLKLGNNVAIGSNTSITQLIITNMIIASWG